MNIEVLRQLMPPPVEPVYPGSREEWNAFMRKTGLGFPEDYYTVVTTYGSGRFLDGEFKIANPFDPGDEGFAERELATLRENRAREPASVPYLLFPETGGLFPFGIDYNGNTFLWKTGRDFDNWPIVCFNGGDYSEVVNCSLVEFLVLLATNALEIDRRRFWGSDFPMQHLQFVPRRLPAGRKRVT